MKQPPLPAGPWVGRNGNAAAASRGKVTALCPVLPPLTTRWTERGRRSTATSRRRLRRSRPLVCSLGRRLTSICSGAFRKRKRRKAKVMAAEAVLALCGLGPVVQPFGLEDAPDAAAVEGRQDVRDGEGPAQTFGFAETAGRQVGRRRGVQTMARFFPVAFQGSRWGRAQGLGQSAAPRSRHLRIVSVLMPWCMARCRRVRWSGRSRRGWRAFVSICRMGHPRPDAAVKRLNWQACSAKANPTGSQRCSATRQLAGATQGRS